MAKMQSSNQSPQANTNRRFLVIMAGMCLSMLGGCLFWQGYSTNPVKFCAGIAVSVTGAVLILAFSRHPKSNGDRGES
jgi:uncharacterized membrane protein HdeD (DUF308 family)